MPTLTDGVLYGLGILVLDFLAWRFVAIRREQARLGLRALMFGLSTYVLFRSGMNPLRAAPWEDQPLRHLLAQMLEVVWWLQGARLVTIVLDRTVLPESWHKERLFQDVFGALVFLAAAVGAIAFVLQLPVRGLLATSGALAVVLGLAIQSTLNDVFSGVVLNATQPFHIGDWVTIGDVEGKVVESNWRATSLLNGQGNIVVIPNSVAARTNIVNANQPSHTHGISVVLPVKPTIRPATVLQALADAAASSDAVLADPKPIVSVRRATNDAIEYEIVCYVDTLSKKIDVRNDLFDLAHRHLLSRGVVLRPLSVPEPATEATDEKHRLLCNVLIFQTLDDGEIAELAAKLTKHEFDTADTIYAAADESGHELHILARGVASVSVPKGGGEIELRRLAPGDSIGQSGILAGVRSGVIVRALTRATVFRLDKSALTPILARRPEVAKEMCRLLTEHHETEKMLLASPEHADQHAGGLLQWIRDGLRRFHELAI
ncbi:MULTISPECIES: mechanosensitive ion channel family protein [Paraburkholderia]|jgi:small-conductance mechanosensitive channel/CRP-like cAMP-binding protein|uniref:Cyclic nucleotide-binding domain-containing protein n=1 Tax=Paraburkholderia terricola TaxID=169427 RepID=A0A1M6XJ10_9BURK|nr:MULTISPECIES: mechanosensitive ion channel family protein [Paraburkholderia]AXE95797.1 mechanosensitive ion channel protein MscS [Paraburkholderia terricola]ORC51722.1 mechanosensitive ion channel protein MscS [Burkholderia sp. A27]SDP28313.1 Cyclic nucleotide-binding domain-containing protein [Paraburkholderia sediminicola]SHL05931.1 Cyclic nucleotide-binding domain-containing protein [Paraburkholderia terricola]